MAPEVAPYHAIRPLKTKHNDLKPASAGFFLGIIHPVETHFHFSGYEGNKHGILETSIIACGHCSAYPFKTHSEQGKYHVNCRRYTGLHYSTP